MKRIAVKIDLEFEEESQSITNNDNGRESIWTNDEYVINITQKNDAPITEVDVTFNGDSLPFSKKSIVEAFNDTLK